VEQEGLLQKGIKMKDACTIKIKCADPSIPKAIAKAMPKTYWQTCLVRSHCRKPNTSDLPHGPSAAPKFNEFERLADAKFNADERTYRGSKLRKFDCEFGGMLEQWDAIRIPHWA
jgi:hypothetical protein